MDASAGGRRRGRRQADEDRRAERTQVFQKTKMCKFHLIGSCQRGSDCRFAHDQRELQTLPDLARTKICKQLLQTGLCEDHQCSYAHSREEYRVVHGFSAADHREAEMQLHQLDAMKRAGRLVEPGLPRPDPRDLRDLRDPRDPRERPPELKANGQKAGLAPPMYQGNLLACATPVLFVPSLQSMVPNDAFAPPVMGLPSSPHEKPGPPGPPGMAPPGPPKAPGPPPSVMKESPLAPGSHPGFNADRLQAMTQFMQPRGPYNGYAHGLDPFEAGRGPGIDLQPMGPEPTNRAIGPKEGRGKVSGGRSALSMPDDDMSFIPSEPAKLQLGSLRSLSSNSLAAQGEDDDYDDVSDRGMGLGMGMPMTGVPMPGPGREALKVKNTFLDYETDCTPLGQRLRPICSAAGRLDALGDEEETGLGALASSIAPVPSVISPNSAPPGVGDLHHIGGLSPGSDSLRSRDLASDGMANLFTVKNTFIECEDPSAEATSLRAVHTAAGRLDTMWRDEEDRFD